jgi:hypothetical protein
MKRLKDGLPNLPVARCLHSQRDECFKDQGPYSSRVPFLEDTIVARVLSFLAGYRGNITRCNQAHATAYLIADISNAAERSNPQPYNKHT